MALDFFGIGKRKLENEKEKNFNAEIDGISKSFAADETGEALVNNAYTEYIEKRKEFHSAHDDAGLANIVLTSEDFKRSDAGKQLGVYLEKYVNLANRYRDPGSRERVYFGRDLQGQDRKRWILAEWLLNFPLTDQERDAYKKKAAAGK